MHKTLVIKAFDKAGELREHLGEHNPSKSCCAEDISMFLEENQFFILSGRQLKNYYNRALKYKFSEEDIHIKQLRVILGLCKYLNYDSYQAFLDGAPREKKNVTYEKPENDYPAIIKIGLKTIQCYAWYRTLSV